MKNEVNYEYPVNLYISKSYDDAETAQEFIKDLAGEQLSVSKGRNGDYLYVSIEGTNEDIDAFLDVYKDTFTDIVWDCDADANGWVKPKDVYDSIGQDGKVLPEESKVGEGRSNEDYLQEVWDSLAVAWDKDKFNMGKGYDSEYECECITITSKDNEEVHAKIYVEDYNGKHPAAFNVVYRYPGDKGVGVMGTYEFQSTDMDGLGEEVFDYFDDIKQKVGESMKNETNSPEEAVKKVLMDASDDAEFRREAGTDFSAEDFEKSIDANIEKLRDVFLEVLYFDDGSFKCDVNDHEETRDICSYVASKVAYILGLSDSVETAIDGYLLWYVVQENIVSDESKKSEAKGPTTGDDALKQMQMDFKQYNGKTTGEIAADIRYDVATALDMPADGVDDVMQSFGLDNIYILRADGVSPKAIAQKILKANDESKKSMGRDQFIKDVLELADAEKQKYYQDELVSFARGYYDHGETSVDKVLSDYFADINESKKSESDETSWALEYLVETAKEKGLKVSWEGSNEICITIGTFPHQDHIFVTDDTPGKDDTSLELYVPAAHINTSGLTLQDVLDYLDDPIGKRDAVQFKNGNRSGKVEAKKSEAKYDRPVTLYATTRYTDAEEARRFIRSITNDNISVSTERNGDTVSVSIEGSDEDIDAFLEVYTDNYVFLESDCDVDVMGWTDPMDLKYYTAQGRKELLGASHKKSEGLPPKRLGSKRQYRSRADLINKMKQLGAVEITTSKQFNDIKNSQWLHTAGYALDTNGNLVAQSYYGDKDGKWYYATTKTFQGDYLPECKEEAKKSEKKDDYALFFETRVPGELTGARMFLTDMWNKMGNKKPRITFETEDPDFDSFVSHPTARVFVCGDTRSIASYARYLLAHYDEIPKDFEGRWVWKDDLAYFARGFKESLESKKLESLTLKQKELKDMARYGEAEDITTISDAEAKELKKKGIETVGISRGVYGMNGALLRDNEGNKYVITARSSNLFYFV